MGNSWSLAGSGCAFATLVPMPQPPQYHLAKCLSAPGIAAVLPAAHGGPWADRRLADVRSSSIDARIRTQRPLQCPETERAVVEPGSDGDDSPLKKQIWIARLG